MTTLTLYTGNEQTTETTKAVLESWCAENCAIDLVYESIHTNPSVAVRLGIHHLPALVFSDQVLAQGAPDRWLTETFLNQLATQIDTTD